MMTGDGDAIVFAERVLALLDSGSFTMSYKYAVLLGLIDCSLEQLSATGEPPSELRARDLSDKVLELYWRQAVPFASGDEPRIIRLRCAPRRRPPPRRTASARH